MFKWYRNAARCYVYLSDVSTGDLTSNLTNDLTGDLTGGVPLHQQWDADFRRSRRFTRGWTLQELLAPAYVEFFSVEAQRVRTNPHHVPQQRRSI